MVLAEKSTSMPRPIIRTAPVSEPNQPYILWPTDTPDRQTMGGKGAALAALNGALPIPAWFVLTPMAFDASVATGERHLAPTVMAALDEALLALDTDPHARFAVRSSAVAEDQANASFAGQLRSFLQVQRTEVADLVVAVWQSAFADQVTEYRTRLNAHSTGDPVRWAPAVIVQRMVDADVAGVAFGADPVSGDRNHCTISAVRGLADQLVSGRVNGDSYLTDRAGRMLAQQTVASMALLSPVTVQSIVQLLARVEAHCGVAQDIEWALADGELYLLQARPITTLGLLEGEGVSRSGSESKRGGVIWDNSNIVESYSGVTAPLTFSFARHVYEHVYLEFCQLMGVAPSRIAAEANAFRNLLGYINGHVYYNLLNWYRILALFPGFQLNRRFMEQMMGVKEPLADELLDTVAPPMSRWARTVDALRLARVAVNLVWGEVTMPRTIKRFYRRLNGALTLTPDDMACMSLQQLAVEYRKVVQQLLAQWDAPLLNDFLCMIAFGLSRKLLERQGGEAGLQLHNALLIGQGDIISAEPAQRIRVMAALAAQDEALVHTLVHGTAADAVVALRQLPELYTAYAAYLAKFGNRCLQELKLESITLHADPTPLLRAIGALAQRAATGQSSGQVAGLPPIAIDQQLTPFFQGEPLRRWFTGAIVRWAKRRVRDRENLRFERTRVFGYARQLFLAMGTRLVEAEVLQEPRDIFLLTIDEVLALVDGAATTYDVPALVALRKAERARFNRLPPPPNRFTSEGLVVQEGAREWGSKQTSKSESRRESRHEGRQGIGCCAGVVRAPVRVVKEPHGATLQPGEILVAQFTDPGWITLFANAAGILVERGSLLSHSAIVARELGIPAIVALDGVMTWLQSGDVVEMDGASGRVCKCQ